VYHKGEYRNKKEYFLQISSELLGYMSQTPLGNIKTTFPTPSPLFFALNLLNLSGAGLPEAGELAGQPAAHLVVSSALF